MGIGFGPAGVAASIAALTDVPADDVGVASGIEESTFQLGTPLGDALLTTLALTRTDAQIAAGVDLQRAQVDGFQRAFVGAAAIAAIALAIAVVLVRPDPRDPGDDPAGDAGRTASEP